MDKKEYIEKYYVLRSLTADHYPWSAYEDSYEIVQNAPAADVAEVKHGKWRRGAEPWSGSIFAHCSACNRKMNRYCYGYAYCPLCGARMDGKGGEAE